MTRCGDCYDEDGTVRPVVLANAPDAENAGGFGRRIENVARAMRFNLPKCGRCGKTSVLSPCRECGDEYDAMKLPAPPGEDDPACVHGRPLRGRETCEKGCHA